MSARPKTTKVAAPQLSETAMTEIVKAAKRIVHPTLRRWTLENVQTRNVAARLNELSASGYEIFAVNQSQAIGGTYEVVYHIDKPVDDIYPSGL